MIDEKKLITEIEKEISGVIVKDVYSKGKNAGLRKVLVLIREQSALNEWVPCNNGIFPTEKGWYLCTCFDQELLGSKPIVYFLYFYPDLQQFIDNIRYSEYDLKNIDKFFWTKQVIAWRPLPEPFYPKNNTKN